MSFVPDMLWLTLQLSALLQHQGKKCDYKLMCVYVYIYIYEEKNPHHPKGLLFSLFWDSSYADAHNEMWPNRKQHPESQDSLSNPSAA